MADWEEHNGLDASLLLWHSNGSAVLDGRNCFNRDWFSLSYTDFYSIGQEPSFAKEEISFLLRHGADAFSAVTLFFGRHNCKRKVIYNDGNAKTRQAADISHELSHAVLGHPATKMFEDDPILDEEAKWMGPCLLIPKAAARWIVRNNMPIATVVEEYGVSPALAQMRIRASGAQIIASRSQRKSG